MRKAEIQSDRFQKEDKTAMKNCSQMKTLLLKQYLSKYID